MERIAVLGGGESGVGAALLAKKKGVGVFVSDYGTIPEKYKLVLKKNKIHFEENGHSFDRIIDADAVVKSPGIPGSAPIIGKIRAENIEIISEIEFAFRYCSGKIVGITGSNGKTTTSLLTYHLLATAGKSVALCGNIGNSFAGELAINAKSEIYVVEISSFQLDDINAFKADVAVLLNITPDHLDRYNYSFDEYANAKCKIANNQEKNDLLIINKKDQKTQENKSRLDKGQVIKQLKESDSLVTLEGLEFETQKFSLSGKHNYYNTLCSIETCIHLGVAKEDIQKGLDTFRNHAHRMEEVTCINGVTFINDSKATNVDSVYYALDSMSNKLVWIVGGVDKGNDYTEILDLVHDKVKVMICLGIDNEKLKTSFNVDSVFEARKMSEAVRLGFDHAKRGDVVLLSPACASFDLFDNYIDRGNKFKESVWSLI